MKKAFKEALMKKVVTVAAVIMLASAVQANDNPIIDTVDNAKDFAVNNKVSQFVVQEYKSILDFQAESWKQCLSLIHI